MPDRSNMMVIVFRHKIHQIDDAHGFFQSGVQGGGGSEHIAMGLAKCNE